MNEQNGSSSNPKQASEDIAVSDPDGSHVTREQELRLLAVVSSMDRGMREYLGRLLGNKPARVRNPKQITNEMIRRNMHMVGEVSHAPGFRPAPTLSLLARGKDAVDYVMEQWEKGEPCDPNGLDFNTDYQEVIGDLDDYGLYAGGSTPEALAAVARGNEGVS